MAIEDGLREPLAVGIDVDGFGKIGTFLYLIFPVLDPEFIELIPAGVDAVDDGELEDEDGVI